MKKEASVHNSSNQIKIYTNPTALRIFVDIINAHQKTNLTVGYVPGCFDLFHIGHEHLLEEASNQCDFLIASVVSDDFVRAKKGESRPIRNRDLRVQDVASQECVDAVIVAPNDRLGKRFIISPNEYRPLAADIAFFGSDYNDTNLPAYFREFAKEVKYVTKDMGCHTTQTLERLGLS